MCTLLVILQIIKITFQLKGSNNNYYYVTWGQVAQLTPYLL